MGMAMSGPGKYNPLAATWGRGGVTKIPREQFFRATKLLEPLAAS